MKRSLEEPSDSLAAMDEQEEEEGRTCVICSGPYSAPGSGDHAVVSLKCGHLFGRSCVLRWLGKAKTASCPSCRTQFRLADVREIFASVVVAVDNGRVDELSRELAEAKRELAALRMKNQLENAPALQNAVVAPNNKPELAVEASVSEVVWKIGLPVEGRVLEHARHDCSLLFSAANKIARIPLAAESSSVAHMRWVPGLHTTGQVRDIRARQSDSVVLSCGTDRAAIVWNCESGNVLGSVDVDGPAFACCWGAAGAERQAPPNDFFVASGNKVRMYDIRCLGEAVSRIVAQMALPWPLPVHSLHSVSASGEVLCASMRGACVLKMPDNRLFNIDIGSVCNGQVYSAAYSSPTRLVGLSFRNHAAPTAEGMAREPAPASHQIWSLEHDLSSTLLCTFTGTSPNTLLSRSVFGELGGDPCYIYGEEFDQTGRVYNVSFQTHARNKISGLAGGPLLDCKIVHKAGVALAATCTATNVQLQKIQATMT